MSKRAIRKKALRKFKVGDLVTWGLGLCAHKIIEVQALGVLVDGGPKFPRLFVAFEAGKRSTRFGLLRHAEVTQPMKRNACTE